MLVYKCSKQDIKSIIKSNKKTHYNIFGKGYKIKKDKEKLKMLYLD